jgi:hypothetical protein
MSSDIQIPVTLVLAQGMAGLPHVQTLDTELLADGLFVDLLAREEPGLGWLAASAEDVRPGMTETLRAGGRISETEVLLVLLASHGDPPEVTANLAGPLAVAPDGTARQLILEDPTYEVRARVGRLVPLPAAAS